jgi:Cytochrome c7 and related cytochrome c
MRRSSWLFLLVVSAGQPLWAQGNRCADCHIANPQADPVPEHTYDWETSAHGRNLVGCETCHEGDATTFESFLAHRGILTSRNPASPTHPNNLPRTCGKCHIGPFVEFQKSRHYQLLREGRGEGPTCSACHGSVAARLLSPRSLEKRCDTCHGPEGIRPNSDFGPDGRILLQEVDAVRELLEGAPKLIDRVKDPARKRALEDAYEQAQVPLREAVHSGHSFVFEQVRERLQAAKERSEALLTELANP